MLDEQTYREMMINHLEQQQIPWRIAYMATTLSEHALRLGRDWVLWLAQLSFRGLAHTGEDEGATSTSGNSI